MQQVPQTVPENDRMLLDRNLFEMACVKQTTSPAAWQVLKPSIRSKINLRMTLCGGQCFHWYPTPRTTFVGAIGHRVYELREVHCPSKLSQMVKKQSPPVSSSGIPASDNSQKAEVVDLMNEVCCWVEYRRLWPQQPTVQPTVASHLSKQQKETGVSLSPSIDNGLAEEPDEILLTRYLSLDVDLAELWLRWTAAPTTRRHPLVTYLIHNSHDAAIASATKKHNTSLWVCEHDSGSPAAVYIPIRHVRGDVHSCLFSFLCSQNNNVARITSMIYTLCRHYGDHLGDVQLATGAVCPPSTGSDVAAFANKTAGSKKGVFPTFPAKEMEEEAYPLRGSSHAKHVNGVAEGAVWLSVYSFPSINQLATATEDKLRSLGFGYRSRYIVQAVKSIAAAPLTKASVTQFIESVPLPLRQQHQACIAQPFYADLLAHHGDIAYQRAKLMDLFGVGRKVADCVLLFSLAHSNLVPVDTHMAQVAVKYLAMSTPVSTTSKEKRTRKRRRSVEQDDHQGTVAVSKRTKGAAVSWQEELQLWGEKARQLQAEASKKAAAEKRFHKSKTKKKVHNGAVRSTEAAEDETEDTAKLLLPPLYEHHHDAIQHGFTELFGPHAGWAHSILFYYRMRK